MVKTNKILLIFYLFFAISNNIHAQNHKNKDAIYYSLPPRADSILSSKIDKRYVIQNSAYAAIEKTCNGSEYIIYISGVLNKKDDNIAFFVARRSERKLRLSNGTEIPVFLDDYDLNFVNPDYHYNDQGNLSRSGGTFVRHGFRIRFNLADKIFEVGGEL